MKLHILVLCSFLCLTQSKAGIIWFTNANPWEAANLSIYTTGSPATELLNIPYGEAAWMVVDPSTYLVANETSGTGELTFYTPADNGDYTVNWDFSDPPNWVPLSVPEPSAISLFMLGFGTTFGTGMMANGARWLRNVVIGSSNE